MMLQAVPGFAWSETPMVLCTPHSATTTPNCKEGVSGFQRRTRKEISDLG